jgi:tetratricopeptide (TPR) repeat protein
MIKKLILAFSILAIISCTSNNKQERIDEINALEKELLSNQNMQIDVAKATELADLFISFVDEFPEDSLSSIYLFKAADLNLNTGSYEKSIALYQRLREEYSTSGNAEIALFMQAYIYDYYLQDYQNAKQKYEAFMKLYPESDFYDEAEISIQQLGKSPEELIKEFEKNNDSTLVDSVI